MRHSRGLHRAELFKPYVEANAFQQSLQAGRGLGGGPALGGDLQDDEAALNEQLKNLPETVPSPAPSTKP